MEINSPAFENGKPIPKKYTCQGANISPELNIQDLPEETKTLAIIVEDPDAPSGTFDHWVAWNIHPSETIAENAKLQDQGLNGFGKKGYGGPCPPAGSRHRYFFRVYALDIKLDLSEGSYKTELLKAMKGHILDKAELLGLYQKE